MPFIEIFLIILGAVVIGIILSVGIIYFIRRYEKPGYPPKKYIIPSHQSSSTPSINNDASTAPKNGSNGDKLEELLKNHKKVEPAAGRTESVGVKASNAWLQPSTGKQPPVVASPAAVQQAAPVAKQAPPVTPSTSPRPPVATSSAARQSATAVQQAAPVVKQTPAVAPLSSPRRPEAASPPIQQTAPVAKKTTVAAPKPATEKPKVQLARSDVYKELESNLVIASAPWSGKLTVFQTASWDTNQDKLGSELAGQLSEITEVYIDIRLANNIVWISNDVGLKSSNLDESYQRLCAKITDRIGKIVASVRGAH